MRCEAGGGVGRPGGYQSQKVTPPGGTSATTLFITQHLLGKTLYLLHLTKYVILHQF